MEEVKISEEELAELKALDHEYAIRERKISKAWLAAHPGVSRGGMQYAGNAGTTRREKTKIL